MSISGPLGPFLFGAAPGENIPDRRESVLIVTTATLGIATIFVVARLVSRLAIVRKVTWDDYFIVLGWVSFIRRRPIFPDQRDAML